MQNSPDYGTRGMILLPSRRNIAECVEKKTILVGGGSKDGTDSYYFGHNGTRLWGGPYNSCVRGHEGLDQQRFERIQCSLYGRRFYRL